jgi:hypothetical protein
MGATVWASKYDGIRAIRSTPARTVNRYGIRRVIEIPPGKTPPAKVHLAKWTV